MTSQQQKDWERAKALIKQGHYDEAEQILHDLKLLPLDQHLERPGTQRYTNSNRDALMTEINRRVAADPVYQQAKTSGMDPKEALAAAVYRAQMDIGLDPTSRSKFNGDTEYDVDSGEVKEKGWWARHRALGTALIVGGGAAVGAGALGAFGGAAGAGAAGSAPAVTAPAVAPAVTGAAAAPSVWSGVARTAIPGAVAGGFNYFQQRMANNANRDASEAELQATREALAAAKEEQEYQRKFAENQRDYDRQQYADYRQRLAPYSQHLRESFNANIPTNGPANLVTMRAPDGSTRQVPQAHVPFYEQRGAVRV